MTAAPCDTRRTCSGFTEMVADEFRRSSEVIAASGGIYMLDIMVRVPNENANQFDDAGSAGEDGKGQQQPRQQCRLPTLAVSRCRGPGRAAGGRRGVVHGRECQTRS